MKRYILCILVVLLAGTVLAQTTHKIVTEERLQAVIQGVEAGTVTGQDITPQSVTANAASFRTLNGVVNAAAMPGADAGAKINAAWAAFVAFGGPIDLRGFGPGVVNYTTPIVLGAPLVAGMPVHPLHIIADLATTFNFVGSGVPFQLNPYGTNGTKIEGLHITCDPTSSATDGLLINGTWYFSLDSYQSEGCPNGLHITNASTVGDYHFEVRNSHATGLTGLLLESVNNMGTNYGVFTNSVFQGKGTSDVGDGNGDGCRIRATGAGTGVWGTTFIGGGCTYSNRNSLNITGPSTFTASATNFEGSGWLWNLDGSKGASTGRGGKSIANDTSVESITIIDGDVTDSRIQTWDCNARGVRIISHGVETFCSGNETETPSTHLPVSPARHIIIPTNVVGAEQRSPADVYSFSGQDYADEYVKLAFGGIDLGTYRRFCYGDISSTRTNCIWFDMALGRFGFGLTSGLPTSWLIPSEVLHNVGDETVAGTKTFINGLDANSAGITHAGAISGISGGSSGKAMCWKTATTLGYCSTVLAADGSCTCN